MYFFWLFYIASNILLNMHCLCDSPFLCTHNQNFDIKIGDFDSAIDLPRLLTNPNLAGQLQRNNPIGTPGYRALEVRNILFCININIIILVYVYVYIYLNSLYLVYTNCYEDQVWLIRLWQTHCFRHLVCWSYCFEDIPQPQWSPHTKRGMQVPNVYITYVHIYICLLYTSDAADE